jgi:hypothetical protein
MIEFEYFIPVHSVLAVNIISYNKMTEQFAHVLQKLLVGPANRTFSSVSSKRFISRRFFLSQVTTLYTPSFIFKHSALMLFMLILIVVHWSTWPGADAENVLCKTACLYLHYLQDELGFWHKRTVFTYIECPSCSYRLCKNVLPSYCCVDTHVPLSK